MLAALDRVTPVVGTDVVVIAIEGSARLTCAIAAAIKHGALAPITAGSIVVCVHTSQAGVAGVVGTDITVITVDRHPRLAG